MQKRIWGTFSAVFRGKDDLYSFGTPGRTPLLRRDSSSTRPNAAAPNTPIASSKLLFPLPFAPTKTLTAPNSTSTFSSDLNDSTENRVIIEESLYQSTSTRHELRTARSVTPRSRGG